MFETVVHVHIHDSLVHLAKQRVFDFDGDGSVALDRDHEDSALRRIKTLVVAQLLKNRRDLVAFEVSEQKLFEAEVGEAVFAS